MAMVKLQKWPTIWETGESLVKVFGQSFADLFKIFQDRLAQGMRAFIG
jgi:hypothetical protein